MTIAINRVGCDRQAETIYNLLDQATLLPIGVLGTAESDQDVIWVEVRDGVGERGQRIVIADGSANADSERVHVPEYRVEALA